MTSIDAPQTDGAMPALAETDILDLYRRMVEIRLFEDKVLELFTRNLVRGSTHLCQGQEAVAVGACDALSPGDTMTCTYRGHGAVLAMGASLSAAMAEILGRAGGLCGGKGGSMHLTDVACGALGSFAIVGANLPVTVGAAFTAKYRGSGAVSLAFFGDGSTNIGGFHEALNLAAVWQVPAVFVCENNLYGEYSPLRSTTPIDRLSVRADSYAMPSAVVDGNDVLAVREAVLHAVDRARAGDGPTFIEALTYRQQGHSRTDPATYRPPGELDAWLERDPLIVLRRRAAAEWQIDEARLDGTYEEARRNVEEATERALASPEPAAGALYEDIYA
ncbi:MAG: acetoin:2,6-dichlorophenolindophenol oxidoreductase subunit alpha [Solirubrobacteraceae bacterium]|jgi:pyruvate dehydrogenase E1 component alpha subunit|nr:acetoin:2,6-dichlorophenolindophenol oxidoreductase subunit alpha [Solirubrobacteraceae bacterium]